MKRLVIWAVLSMAGIAVWAASPAATIALNNLDANQGNGVPIYSFPGILAPVGQNILVEILGGPDGSHMRPITDINGNAIVIPMGAGGAGAGFFDAGAGLVPEVAPSAFATFQVEIWKGAGGFPGEWSYRSATWAQATGSWPGDPLVPVVGPALQFPKVILAPETSTLALGLLGGLALLIRRCRG